MARDEVRNSRTSRLGHGLAEASGRTTSVRHERAGASLLTTAARVGAFPRMLRKCPTEKSGWRRMVWGSTYRQSFSASNGECAGEGAIMASAHVNATVRLTHDVPTLWLNRGDVGVVRSIWLSPTDCYEVEFHKPGEPSVRALLDAQLFELVEPSLVGGEIPEQRGVEK